jgi:hypothetical protein
MEFEENNEEFERKRTRNLKEKHREFLTRDVRILVKKLAKIVFPKSNKFFT